MRRRTASLVAGLGLLATVIALVPGSPVSAAGADPDVIPGSWIVELRAGNDPHTAAPRLARQHGGEVGHVYDAALNGFSFKGSDRAAASLARNPRVARVEADRRVHALAPDQVPTGIRRIDATDSSGNGNLSTSGSGVAVAVLDTGISTHEAFGSRLKSGKACGYSTTADGHGHGTHVAGTVGGTKIGVAQGVDLVPVKVLSDSGSGSWEDVLCGINWVTSNASWIKVANMSLGGSSSEDVSTGCGSSTMHTAICNSVNAGVTYVVAAGNDGRDASGFVPAKYPEVLTVSAFSDLDGLRDPDTNECSGKGPWQKCDEQLAGFSNHGSIVDVMAPGVSIYSSVPGNKYDTYSGTSMAAPHVAGVTALALAAGKATGPASVETLLESTGECPAGTWASSTGSCSGTWRNDPDGITEPMVNAARAVSGTTGGGGGGGGGDTADATAPTVSITDPTGGTVSGTKVIQVDASDNKDAAGSLDVDVRIDGGTWLDAAWNSATSRYEYSWNTTGVGDGSHTIDARATDAALNTGTAAQVTVTVDNVQESTSGITLSVYAYKIKGWQYADLTWTDTPSSTVDIYRKLDGSATFDKILTGTADDGFQTDATGYKGGGMTWVYKVCEAGSETSCSNEALAVH